MAFRPPIMRQRYNHQIHGVYGEFGAGGGLRAFYLESTLTPSELSRISLISDISGSETWGVRDLFQRDVDNERVTEGLLPYLQDEGKIKFFNPLTLTALPMDGDGVRDDMLPVFENQIQEDEQTWDCLTRNGYYRVRWIHGFHQYAILEWNDSTTRLVAIDGQHRLSALKRYEYDPHASSHGKFSEWRIPIVVVCFRKDGGDGQQPRVLDVVRNIFVYINTEARVVNSARQILLKDDSPNCICTQELLQRSHSNDLLPREDRDNDRLPLLFFDWRGEERSGQRIAAPASVKSIEEVHDWFRYHILGDDFGHLQELALGITPAHELQRVFHENRQNSTRKIDHLSAVRLRELVNLELLPAVAYVLENFLPYRAYTRELRSLEDFYNRESDLARHAFYELRFGTNPAMEANKDQVERILARLKDDIEGKKSFDELVQREIGMRGVTFAFGELRRSFGRPDWMEYAMWFTDALNRAYEGQWLDLRPGSNGERHLRQIVKDHNDSIINYRFGHIDDSIGAYVSLLVAAFGRGWPITWAGDESTSREERLERLEGSIRRGYKKQVRPGLKLEHPNGGRELTEAVNESATELAKGHVRRIEQALKGIEDAQDRNSLSEGTC